VHYVVTHEGGGPGGVPRTMSASCKGATPGDTLALRGSEAPFSDAQVQAWFVKALESPAGDAVFF